MEQPKLIVSASDDLIEVVRRMRVQGVDRCPVVDNLTSMRLVGFLSPSDILRARMARARRPDDDKKFELFQQ